MHETKSACAFVATSSVCEGLQVPTLWPHLLKDGVAINFAIRPFKWSNLAKSNAGVTVVVVGLAMGDQKARVIFDGDQRIAPEKISAYLTPGETVFVDTAPSSRANLPRMVMGGMPRDGGNLIFSFEEAKVLTASSMSAGQYLRPYVGSAELVRGT